MNRPLPKVLYSDLWHQEKSEIESFIRDLLTSLKGPTGLMDALFYGALSGGKRLRPLLHLEALQALGGDRQKGLASAAALELVHCYSLIHDDLPAMDDARLRRGQPTVHKKFDEATAILAGTGLLGLAFEVLEGASFKDAIKLKLIKRLAHASGPEGMIAGQWLDLEGEKAPFALGLVETMQVLKTGALIECALLMASDILDASPESEQALASYGRAIGLAFQIRDDLLDLESSTHNLGKDTGHDAGKSTFVSLLGAEKARQYGEELVGTALHHLKILPGPTQGLEEIALYILGRSY